VAREKKYYKLLQRWARRQGYYCEDDWKNIGDKKFRADVVAVKNISVSWQDDDIELIAFEVKTWLDAKSISQASNYFDIVDRVYVVQTESADYIKKEIIERCLTNSIGLIAIKNNACNIMLQAPFVHHKEEDVRTRFLEHRLGIFKCVICGKYFDETKKDHWTWIIRERNYREKNTPAVHRLIWKTICEKCKNEFGHILNRKLENEVKELRGEVTWLSEKVDSHIKKVASERRQ
jgi:hypothetical protein